MQVYSSKKTYNRNNAKASTVNAFFKDMFKTIYTEQVIDNNSTIQLHGLRLKASCTVEETIYDCGTHNLTISMETYYIYEGVHVPIHDVMFSTDGLNFDRCYDAIRVAFQNENFKKTQKTVDKVMRVMDNYGMGLRMVCYE
jgi:hypothetical protein